MLLVPTSATEEKQRWWNKLFTCGSGNYLERENGGDSLLSIFGYPVVDERGTSVTTGDYPPLRLSWGIEKYTGDTDPDHHIFYDVDTLGGNSGSPVIGRGSKDGQYEVKAIHIHGTRGNKLNNSGQGFKHINEWNALKSKIE